MPLSEHVYCVAVTFKMTERAEKWICIIFWVKLEHSSMQTKDDSEGPSYRQPVMGSFITTTCLFSYHVLCRVLVKHQITQVTQPHYRPDLSSCDIWLFPKLRSLLKGKRFQTAHESQENTTGQLIVIGRTVWGPRCLLQRGLRCHCPVYNVSCILHLP